MGLRPDPVVLPSDWAEEHLILADGPKAGFRWDRKMTPYAPGILDCLSRHHRTTASASENLRRSLDGADDRLGGGNHRYRTLQDHAGHADNFNGAGFQPGKLSPTIDQTKVLNRKYVSQCGGQVNHRRHCQSAFLAGL